MNRTLEETSQERLAGGTRHGVVFVHGVGDQRKSDTLLDMGGALLDWLTRWHKSRDEPAPCIECTELSFTAVDAGEGDTVPRATIRFRDGAGDRVWVLAEAWWAASNRRPGLGTMLGWSWTHLRSIMGHLIDSMTVRINRLTGREQDPLLPGRWALRVDVINCLGMLAIYGIGAVLGYALLLPLMILAQIPIPGFQDFILLRLIKPFLVVNAGEFRTYLDDDIQASNMHRRVAAVVTFLVEQEQCQDVSIVAHSEGAVVSFGMLTDRDSRLSDAQRRVRKFITLGAGLNKSWQVKPDLKRLEGPIPSHIHWVDMWASYDPVPAGWLQPWLKDTSKDGGRWARIFCPNEAVIAEQRLVPRPNPDPFHVQSPRWKRAPDDVYWPVSIFVTNKMNVVADHGAYLGNDEQVMVRIAAEIDRPNHRESRYWRGQSILTQDEEYTREMILAVRRRRARVTVLTLFRDIAALISLGLSIWLCLDLVNWKGIGALMTPIGGIKLHNGLAGLVASALNWLRQLPGFLGDLANGVMVVPFSVLGSLALVVAVILIFSLCRTLFWDPMDQRARLRAIAAMATAVAPLAGRGRSEVPVTHPA